MIKSKVYGIKERDLSPELLKNGKSIVVFAERNEEDEGSLHYQFLIANTERYEITNEEQHIIIQGDITGNPVIFFSENSKFNRYLITNAFNSNLVVFESNEGTEFIEILPLEIYEFINFYLTILDTDLTDYTQLGSSDWYYKNNTLVPSVLQSDWSQTDNTKDDYIKNKPALPSSVIFPYTTDTNSNADLYIYYYIYGVNNYYSISDTFNDVTPTGSNPYNVEVLLPATIWSLEMRSSTQNLTDIDLTNLTSLKTLIINKNKLTTIDLLALVNLTRLEIANTGTLTTLDLTALELLTYLVVDNNPVTSITYYDESLITYLGLQYTNLASIDLTAFVNLTAYNISNNSLVETIDVSGLDLTTISSQLSNCAIVETIDISNNTNLTSLTIENDLLLTDVITTGCTALLTYSIRYGAFTQNPSIPNNVRNIYLENISNLTTVDVSNITDLRALTVVFSGLTTLTLPASFANIGDINLYNNQLTNTTIDAIFTALPVVTGLHRIYVRNNPGSATCTTSIATLKGWTVYTT